jgi:L-methionine (R)-S-oxide reductase
MSDKAELYADLAKQIEAVVTGEPNATARYASAACLLREAFPERFFWTGFYVVDADKPDELVVGPYQGSLGCMRIAFGRGVCGTAAQTGQTQLVADVHAFPGHIACDSRSNSEIVVPVFDDAGELAAVLDIDSTLYGAFDKVDQDALETICAKLLTH